MELAEATQRLRVDREQAEGDSETHQEHDAVSVARNGHPPAGGGSEEDPIWQDDRR